MGTYRIHRLKQHLQQQFRGASHVSGIANVKPRDYEPGPVPELIAEAVDAATPYAAYFQLRDSVAPLVPGDLLEAANGMLSIYKYVGFEEARWVFPEPKANAAGPVEHGAEQEPAETVAGA